MCVDGRLAFGHHQRGFGEIRLRHRHRDDLAARRVLERKRVEPAVQAERHALDLVGMVGDLRPLAVGAAKVEGVLAAVAVGHPRQHIAAVARSAQLGFRDARELLADHVGVRARRRAELVEIHLLVEVHVFPGALASLRVARVVEAGALRVPGDAAPAGGIAHARHAVGEFLAGGRLEHVHGPVLAAVFRDRHRDVLAVQRRRVEIDRRGALRVDLVGIDEDALATSRRPPTSSPPASAGSSAAGASSRTRRRDARNRSSAPAPCRRGP